jgi:membrane protein
MSKMSESPTISSSESDRGRSANRPSEIPLRGWRDILWRMWTQIGDDNMFIIAAGVAFYAMLAIFPAITSFVSLFGLITEASQVQDQFANFRDVMPEDAWSLLNDQLTAVVSASAESLGVGAIVGLLVALWTAGAGVRAMMSALNIAYREQEKRSFLAFYFTAFLFTIGIVVLAILAVGLIVAVPVILAIFEPGGLTALLAKVIPWSVMAVFLVAALGAVYRFGPSRHEPKARWVSWGAVLATVLWIAASVGFSIYVSNFASYNETYGALGAVMILLMWLWISAFIVLLGAELNAEMEHQTERDTTTGRPRPLGRRGAYVADHVGEVP